MAEKKSINLRFDEDELALVRDRAARLGVSLQQYLHNLAMNEVNEIQRAFVASARRTFNEYADAFPAPDADRAAGARAREREQDAARADEAASRTGGQAA
jgi:hypothetical protein